jgi:hypothetical protein
MNKAVEELIPAIVSYVIEHNGYVTKTKLLKLLYLFDVEFFRANRKIFTGFEWKFFHLGPWTSEYEPMINSLVARGILLEQPSARSEYDTKFFRSSSHCEVSSLFSSFAEEAVLRRVLNTWGENSTGEILDYVYFRTEPMEHGIRNERLDFTHIPHEEPAKYIRNASGVTKKDVKRLRAELATRLKDLQNRQPFEFTEPNYDEQFQVEMDRLEKRN